MPHCTGVMRASPTVTDFKTRLTLHQLLAALEEIRGVLGDFAPAIVQFLALVHHVASAAFHCLTPVFRSSADVPPSVAPRFRCIENGDPRAHHCPRDKPTQSAAVVFVHNSPVHILVG